MVELIEKHTASIANSLKSMLSSFIEERGGPKYQGDI